MECKHNYLILKNESSHWFADGKPILVNIDCVFYCSKCLDIKHIKKDIESSNV